MNDDVDMAIEQMQAFMRTSEHVAWALRELHWASPQGDDLFAAFLGQLGRQLEDSLRGARSAVKLLQGTVRAGVEQCPKT